MSVLIPKWTSKTINTVLSGTTRQFIMKIDNLYERHVYSLVKLKGSNVDEIQGNGILIFQLDFKCYDHFKQFGNLL